MLIISLNHMNGPVVMQTYGERSKVLVTLLLNIPGYCDTTLCRWASSS